MTINRISGIALLAGSAGILLTLGMHPEREVLQPGVFDAMATRLIAVHSFGMACLPLWFLGGCGLARRERHHHLGIFGLTIYGFSAVAMMIALVLDGIVSTKVVLKMLYATPPTNDMWRVVLSYNAIANAAFVYVFIVASSAAIVIWSAGMIHDRGFWRGLGVYGCILGVATVVALFSSQASVRMHAFPLGLVGQALWLGLAGGLLLRTKEA